MEIVRISFYINEDLQSICSWFMATGKNVSGLVCDNIKHKLNYSTNPLFLALFIVFIHGVLSELFKCIKFWVQRIKHFVLSLTLRLYQGLFLGPQIPDCKIMLQIKWWFIFKTLYTALNQNLKIRECQKIGFVKTAGWIEKYLIGQKWLKLCPKGKFQKFHSYGPKSY